MRIGLDIDDVWYPWYARAHELCCEAGIVPKLDSGEFMTPQTWASYEEYGVKLEDWVRALEDAGRRLYDADPDPELFPMLAEFALDGHEVWLITARGSFGPPAMQQNIRRWSREYMEEIGIGWALRDRLLFSKDKTILRLDAFIDDNLRNVAAVAATGTRTFLMTQPWNANERPPSGVTRVYSLAQFRAEIRVMKENAL